MILASFKRMFLAIAVFIGLLIAANSYIEIGFGISILVVMLGLISGQQLIKGIFGFNINILARSQTQTIYGFNWILASMASNGRMGMGLGMHTGAERKSRFKPPSFMKYSKGAIESLQLPGPILGSFKITNSGATVSFRAKIPEGQRREMFERNDKGIGSAFPNHPEFGEVTHIAILPDVESDLKSMKVVVSYKHLPPSMEELEPLEMESRSKFFIGQNHLAKELWDVLKQPHLVVFGTSGGGKSNFLRILAAQAKLSVYWKAIVIDGQGSGQWVSFDNDDENFLLEEMASNPEEEAASAEHINETLQSIISEIALRRNLLKQYRVDNFGDLPDEVQLKHKRWLIIIDEANGVVGKINNKELADARKTFCHLIESNAKQIRKWGGHIVYSDQVTHPKNTYLDSGIFEQFMRFILVCNADDDTQGLIGAKGVPTLPEEAPSAAISGVRNEGSTGIRIPLVTAERYYKKFGWGDMPVVVSELEEDAMVADALDSIEDEIEIVS